MMKAQRDSRYRETKFLRAKWMQEPKLCLVITIKPPRAAGALCNCYLFSPKSQWKFLISIVLIL
jgi:hypothetical protein